MDIRPGAITMLIGGVVIFISTFLDWFGFGPFGANAYDGDFFGFTGILLLLLALDVIAVTAIRAFAPQENLPNELLGFSMNEIALFVGIAAFVWGFSISFVDGSESGTLLCALGGILVAVGAVLEHRADSVPSATI